MALDIQMFTCFLNYGIFAKGGGLFNILSYKLDLAYEYRGVCGYMCVCIIYINMYIYMCKYNDKFDKVLSNSKYSLYGGISYGILVSLFPKCHMLY